MLFKRTTLVTLLLFIFSNFVNAQNPTDACAGVQALAVNGACVTSAYTLPGGYANGAMVLASCTGGQDRDDGWYSVTATSTGTMTIDLTGNRGRTLAVFTICGGGVELACDVQPSGTTASVSFAATIGVTYFVQVHRNQGNNTANMTGTVCAYLVPAPATCSDGIQNGGETGIDCGGPCPACPTCSDGIQNGGETGIDCGGPCPACPPSCTDGIQNGGETGIDCGGPCPACAPAIVPTACTNATYNLTTLETRAFHDDGGPGGDPCADIGAGGNYCNCNCFTTTTICAAAGEFLIIDFSEFAMWNTTSGWDWMKIYDGPNTGSPILYDNSSTGPDNPFGDCGIAGAAMDFCAVGQCMTFEFWATSVVNRAGWDANVSSVSTPCIFLPIELASYNVTCDASGTTITWATHSESNNDYFSIERSTDGINFTSIKIIDGAGNSTETLDYRYTDLTDNKGIQYYRIRQTDYDGKSTYSNSRSVNCGERIRIYPNPTFDNLFVELDETISGTLQITITDVLGNVVSEHLSVEKNSKTYQLTEFGNLNPGIYMIRVLDLNGETVKLEKVVKK